MPIELEGVKSPMNFLIAVIIGAVVGGIGGFVLRSKQPNAIWLAPALGVVGALAASALATAVGDPGYGWKEATLQVVMAVVGVGVVGFLAIRGGQSGDAASTTT
ncbi:MAG: GlsB/YeaQ/YmgE family stress response membrane protein [Micromonosporaceae bacterium]|nr:GlsB/YeaQ/YmgE family stress response membrane protein [Micromonosporaceae bacterium]